MKLVWFLVIVEEAAEVLEAHIVAALSTSVNKVILIGMYDIVVLLIKSVKPTCST